MPLQCRTCASAASFESGYEATAGVSGLLYSAPPIGGAERTPSLDTSRKRTSLGQQRRANSKARSTPRKLTRATSRPRAASSGGVGVIAAPATMWLKLAPWVASSRFQLAASPTSPVKSSSRRVASSGAKKRDAASGGACCLGRGAAILSNTTQLPPGFAASQVWTT